MNRTDGQTDERTIARTKRNEMKRNETKQIEQRPSRPAVPPNRNSKPLQQVDQNYLVNIYVDDLPVYGPVGEMMQTGASIEKKAGVYVTQRCAYVYMYYLVNSVGYRLEKL